MVKYKYKLSVINGDLNVKSKMDIDIESIALLSLVLRESPQDHQFILCVLARSNTIPSPIKFHSNTDYPTFYEYSNERIPFYLMGKGVISNVPRQGYDKRLISSGHLAYAETVINKTTNWGMGGKLEFVAKFIVLDNRTEYKDSEVYLVFRDKAQDYLRDYVSKNEGKISRFLESKLSRFEFGNSLLDQNEKERLPEVAKKEMTPKQISKEILENHKFSKMQKKLISKLSEAYPKGMETEKLANEVNTPDLPSLKKRTLDKIKKLGLSQILQIGSYKQGFTHYYRLISTEVATITKKL